MTPKEAAGKIADAVLTEDPDSVERIEDFDSVQGDVLFYVNVDVLGITPEWESANRDEIALEFRKLFFPGTDWDARYGDPSPRIVSWTDKWGFTQVVMPRNMVTPGTDRDRILGQEEGHLEKVHRDLLAEVYKKAEAEAVFTTPAFNFMVGPYPRSWFPNGARSEVEVGLYLFRLYGNYARPPALVTFAETYESYDDEEKAVYFVIAVANEVLQVILGQRDQDRILGQELMTFDEFVPKLIHGLGEYLEVNQFSEDDSSVRVIDLFHAHVHVFPPSTATSFTETLSELTGVDQGLFFLASGTLNQDLHRGFMVMLVGTPKALLQIYSSLTSGGAQDRILGQREYPVLTYPVFIEALLSAIEEVHAKYPVQRGSNTFRIEIRLGNFKNVPGKYRLLKMFESQLAHTTGAPIKLADRSFYDREEYFLLTAYGTLYWFGKIYEQLAAGTDRDRILGQEEEVDLTLFDPHDVSNEAYTQISETAYDDAYSQQAWEMFLQWLDDSELTMFDEVHEDPYYNPNLTEVFEQLVEFVSMVWDDEYPDFIYEISGGEFERQTEIKLSDVPEEQHEDLWELLNQMEHFILEEYETLFLQNFRYRIQDFVDTTKESDSYRILGQRVQPHGQMPKLTYPLFRDNLITALDKLFSRETDALPEFITYVYIGMYRPEMNRDRLFRNLEGELSSEIGIDVYPMLKDVFDYGVINRIELAAFGSVYELDEIYTRLISGGESDRILGVSLPRQ